MWEFVCLYVHCVHFHVKVGQGLDSQRSFNVLSLQDQICWSFSKMKQMQANKLTRYVSGKIAVELMQSNIRITH